MGILFTYLAYFFYLCEIFLVINTFSEIKHDRIQTEYNIRFIMYAILHQYSRKEKERDLSSNMPCFLIDKTIIFLYDGDVRDTVQHERTVENSSEYRSREQVKKSRERERQMRAHSLCAAFMIKWARLFFHHLHFQITKYVYILNFGRMIREIYHNIICSHSFLKYTL